MFIGGLSLIVALLLATPHAIAQVDRLDRARFIEGLAERRMSELLGHYIEKVRDQLDPIDAAQLRIQQLLMEYRDNTGIPDPARQQAAKDAFYKAVEERSKLIADHAGHRLRPVWQTDLAEMLLVQQMKGVGNEADLFYEFGVPSREQREVFADAAVKALVAASGAYDGFDRLTGEMGRQPQVREELELTGMLYEIENYRDIRSPYYLAHAAYFVSLLPDDHPYYAEIAAGKRNPAVPGQAATIVLERQRLLGEALDRIDPFAKDTSDTYGVRKRAMALDGRVMAAQGDAEDAVATMLTPVINDTSLAGETFHLAAALGKVMALVKAGDFGAAQDDVAALAQHTLVQQSELYGLLLTDAEHRVLMAEVNKAPAEVRKDLIATAYEPYVTFLDSLDPGQQRQTMRNFIFQRWHATLPPDADAAQYPPMVRMALAEIAAGRASQALQDGDTEEAKRLFDRAVSIGNTLTDPSLPDSIRAQGMFNLGAAIYQREALKESGQDLAQMLRMIDLMTTVAREMPGEPVAETAIGAAMQFSRQLEELTPRPAGAEEAYKAASEVLFSQYDATTVADEQRVYYAQTILQARGRFEEAEQMYARVPFTSPDYFLAQQLRLDALRSNWQSRQDAAAREEAAQLLRNEAERIYGESIAEHDRTRDPVRQEESLRSAAAAKLALATLEIGSGQPQRAAEVLAGFEAEFNDDPYYVPLALEKRIIAQVELGRLEDAASEARRMMEQYPDMAAAVVSQVLDTLEREIARLVSEAEAEPLEAKRKPLRDQAAQRAAVAVKLAEVLLEWAEGKNLSKAEMLPYQLPLVRSLRLSGKADQALPKVQEMIAAFPNNAPVIMETAEVLYATGQPDNLREARKHYIRLISGTENERGPIYWRSWVRVLSIADQLNEKTNEIPARVRQLRKQVDENLGGPEFERALQALHDKYAG